MGLGWKNHPDEIARLLPITIGSKTFTDANAVVDILKGSPHPTKCDKFVQRFLAAELNIASCNYTNAFLSYIISKANDFMTNAACSNMKDNALMQEFNYVSDTLDDFNNNLTQFPNR
jgi:hypothetical protein